MNRNVNTTPHDAAITRHRHALEALAYRMTGDHAVSQDIAQETFIKLIEQPEGAFEDDTHLEAWLIRVTINRARDVLRHRKSRAYIGPWLPVPLDHDEAFGTHSREGSRSATRALDALISREGLQYGLLMLLEELTPTQRAVVMLRKVCGYTTRECAVALELSESNVKKTLSRANARLSEGPETLWQAPDAQSVARHAEALFELMGALMTQDVEKLEALLHRDVVLRNDAGGEFIAALRPIVGRERVLRFLLARAAKASMAGPETTVSMSVCNGLPALLIELVAPAGGRIAPRMVCLIHHDEADATIAAVELVSRSSKIAHITH